MKWTATRMLNINPENDKSTEIKDSFSVYPKYFFRIQVHNRAASIDGDIFIEDHYMVDTSDARIFALESFLCLLFQIFTNIFICITLIAAIDIDKDFIYAAIALSTCSIRMNIFSLRKMQEAVIVFKVANKTSSLFKGKRNE